MNEVEKKMGEIEHAAPISDSSTPAVAPAPPPPPPPAQRRPRVREVGSRFMSPVPSSSSSSCSDLHLLTSKSPHHRQQQQRHHRRHHHDNNNKDTESVSSADENRPMETARSLESPFPFQRRHQQQQQPRSVMKLFNDDNNNNNNGFKLTTRHSNSLRPDTPTVGMNSSSSRPRTIQRSSSTAATKLLQSLSIGQPSVNSSQDDTSSNVDDSDNQSTNSDGDMLPTVVSSARLLSERNVNRVNVTGTAAASSLISRSLNLPLSNSQNSLFSSSIKGGEKPTPALSRSFSKSSDKIGGLLLPPVPPQQAKAGNDAVKKGRKVSSYQEDVHSLKLLHNHYLQWRFANAKAEASLQAQRRETERSLYSLGVKISELYDSVKRKRVELEILKRTKTLSTILDSQMPYLDEWCAFEDEYSSSLSEAIQALLNTLIQLPISGNVRADVKDVREALNSASKLVEIIFLHLQSLMPKAEEVESLISELAKVTGAERALIEECGNLLSKTQAFQVEECSLRGHLLQLHKRLAVPGQFQKDNNNSSLNAVHMR